MYIDFFVERFSEHRRRLGGQSSGPWHTAFCEEFVCMANAQVLAKDIPRILCSHDSAVNVRYSSDGLSLHYRWSV